MFFSTPRFFLLATILVMNNSCTTHSHQVYTVAEGDSFPGDKTIVNNTISNAKVLKLLTLNIAHGRKDAMNQVFLSKERIQQNLSEIAHVLVKQNADVIALQEADGPSLWSGGFNHVEAIAKQANYPWYYQAENASSWLFSYGTAILSRSPVSETLAYSFKPSPPTLNKGFLLTRISWKPDPGADEEINIDIISVHLDFSRQKVRENQIAEMKEVLSKRNNPMIILGDFNSEWFSSRSVVKRLAEEGSLKVYQPQADHLSTYNSRGSRLDWILISNELEFVSYEVLQDTLSDHLAVVAEVQLSNE